MAQKQQLRGRPIYVDTGNSVVSLVPEAVRSRSSWLRGRSGYSGQLSGTAVYVIDEAGVRKLAIRGNQGWVYVGITAGMLAAWLQYFVVRRLKRG